MTTALKKLWPFGPLPSEHQQRISATSASSEAHSLDTQLRLIDSTPPHLGGDGLDLPRRHAGRPHVADRRGELLVGARPPPDQVVGEVAALAQLGDPERHRPDAGVERALAVAVARHAELGGLLVHRGVDQPLQQRPQRRVDADRAIGANAGRGQRPPSRTVSVAAVLSRESGVVVTHDPRGRPRPWGRRPADHLRQISGRIPAT